jgi:hypothetical protein
MDKPLHFLHLSLRVLREDHRGRDLLLRLAGMLYELALRWRTAKLELAPRAK